MGSGIVLLIAIAGCKKDKKAISACGIENPTLNLTWLKQTIDSLRAHTIGGSVSLFTHEGQDYFGFGVAPLSCATCYFLTCDGRPLTYPNDTTLMMQLSIEWDRKLLLTYGEY